MAVTEQFYFELQHVDGLEVMPVHQVIRTMYDLGIDRVESTEDVLALSDELDVDGVIIGSITEYDPYFPPRIGMVIQLYGRPDRLGPMVNPAGPEQGVDPGELSRQARPFRIEAGTPVKPLQMVVRVFDADKQEVVQRIKRYAEARLGAQGPSDWRRYATSREYLGFVSYEVIRDLLAREADRIEALMPEDVEH